MLFAPQISFAVQGSRHIPADKPHQKITFLNRTKQGISPFTVMRPFNTTKEEKSQNEMYSITS